MIYETITEISFILHDITSISVRGIEYFYVTDIYVGS